MNMRKGESQLIMKKRLTVLVAGALAAAMTFGMTVCAATSSTTTNTAVSSIVISKDSTGVATATVGSVKIAADYNNVTVPNAVGTAVSAPAKEAATSALTDYVKAQLATVPGTIVGTYKLRLYKAGVALTKDFGTMPVSFGVGNKYDGKTATVYQIHADGTITATVVTVVKGKVSLPITEMGSFAVVINQ
jgi:hypothetical protein